jgi:hypothetical protein
LKQVPETRTHVSRAAVSNSLIGSLRADAIFLLSARNRTQTQTLDQNPSKYCRRDIVVLKSRSYFHHPNQRRERRCWGFQWSANGMAEVHGRRSGGLHFCTAAARLCCFWMGGTWRDGRPVDPTNRVVGCWRASHLLLLRVLRLCTVVFLVLSTVATYVHSSRIVENHHCAQSKLLGQRARLLDKEKEQVRGE